jgi:hypothetical protein
MWGCSISCVDNGIAKLSTSAHAKETSMDQVSRYNNEAI